MFTNKTKIFASLVGLLLVLLMLMTGITPASATTTVSISPSTEIVSQGQNFTINISIEPDTAIAGAQFNLQFNSSIINVNSVTEGELFKQNGANTLFNPGTIDNVAGVVTHVWGNILNTSGAPKNVSTSSIFAIINITASNTAAGTSPLALIGRSPISVMVSDPEGNPVPINVINGTVKVNRAPELDSIGDKSVNRGQTLTFTITATDPDGDSLTYSASNMPSGANFDPSSRTFSWTPNHEQAGTYPNVYFEVTDGHLNDSEDIMITINNTNFVASISNLQNNTGTTWINWTWTNPSDNDFNHTMVYLNGTWQTNTSNPYYNATGLIANTSYEIGTHTVDINGNVNTTWVNQTAKTIAHSETSPPLVTNPTATPATILNDNGRPRVPGTNSSQLNVTVTDDTGVDTVTIDLSPIGGSATAQMTRIPGTDIWTVTVNATNDKHGTHDLVVNATDKAGYSNTSISVTLSVRIRGDIYPVAGGDGIVNVQDGFCMQKYLAEDGPPPDMFVGDIYPATGDGVINVQDGFYLEKFLLDKEDAP
jgi:hypothetical protein